MRSITCEDCGAERPTVRRNTKYCHLCRLFRDFKFVGAKTKKCFVCSSVFAPLNHNDSMCSTCDDLRRNHNVPGTCSLCHKDTHLWSSDVAVCAVCIRNPKHRGQLIKALILKQRERAA